MVETFSTNSVKPFSIRYGQSKSRLMLILSALVVFAGCKRYSLDEIEVIFNIKLKGKVEFLKVDEQWNDFNGNGEKVVVFDLKVQSARNLFESAQMNGFKISNTNTEEENFTKRELMYIGGDVLYKTSYRDNEVRTLVIDTLHKKLTYYYGLQ